MNHQHPFTWRHVESEIIVLCLRWYLRYPLSYRDLEELMRQRGLSMDHTTIYRSRAACTDSWRVDETSIKAKKVWTSLSRAVDSEGNAPSVSVESDTRCRSRQTLCVSKRCTPRCVQLKKGVRSRSRWKSPRLSLTPSSPYWPLA